MEDFANLYWRIDKPTDLEPETEFISDDNIEQSLIYKNNLISTTEFDIEKPDKSIEEEKLDKADKGQKTLKSNLKKHSRLSKAQQSHCLEALKLLQSGRLLSNFNKKEQQLINTYNNLKSVINDEHIEFLQFIEQCWHEQSHLRTNYLLKRMHNFGLNKRNQKLERLKHYPEFYKEKCMISLSKNHDSIQVLPETCVLQLGNVGELKLPNLQKNKNMNINSIPSDKNKLIEESLFTTKLSVSEDIHAEYLAKQTGCRIVISSSCLKTIIDNFGPEFNINWNIPVIVKEHIVNESKVNIVYVDKPFPQRKITMADLNSNVRKVLLKTNMCRKTCHSFETPKAIIDNYISAKPQINDDDNTDKKNTVNVEEKAKKVTTNQKLILNQNVSYRVWGMETVDESNALMKNNLGHKKIKILVRTKTDAYQVIKPGEFMPVNLLPKIEFQSEHGGEMFTKSELLRQWTTLFFRPFSSLYRVRINPKTNTYLKIEQLNLNLVSNECLKNYGYVPKDNLNMLFNILSGMTNLEPGKYLLHHVTKHGPFVALMKSCENVSDAFNLHNFYGEENCSIENISKWIPIDKTVILPHHNRSNRLPGIFPPNPYDNKVERKGKKRKLKALD